MRNFNYQPNRKEEAMQSQVVYEIFNCDSGAFFTITKKKAEKIFGKAEFKEMVLGYFPNWVVTEIH
jgi:hypothetical protein